MNAENINQNIQRAKSESFLLAGGNLGELIRQYAWEKTPLGSPEAWPESLKTTVRIMLTSQQPIWIGWGADLIKLYNDPYKNILGEKHPAALGMPVSEVWTEIWDALAPRLRKVVEKNEGTFDEALLLIIDRYGYKEETYFTFSYSPIPDETGGVGGVFCATTEETKKVIYERELTLLNDLSRQISTAGSSEEIIRLSAQSFSSNKKDIPFAIFYSLDKEKNTLKLVGSSGVEPDTKFAPDEVEVDDNSFLPFNKALEAEDFFPVDIETWRGELPTGEWPNPPNQLALVPLHENKVVIGVLVLGLNPYRPIDDAYKAFVLNLKKQISDNLTYLNAAQEKRRYITEVFRQAPAAIAVVEGDDLVYTLANPLYQQLLGRTEDQLLGNSVSEVFPEFEGQGIIAILKDVLKTGKTFEALEYKLLLDRAANGNLDVFYFNFVIQTIPDKMGHKNAVMIHAADVTGQILAKQKLKESEEKYKNLFTTMGQGFCIIELIFDEDSTPIDYLFVEVNPTFEKQTGLKSAAGKTVKELIPDLESHWFDIYGKIALTGIPYRFVEWSAVMKRWFEVYAFRVGGENSRKVALLFSDITKQKQEAQAMEKSEAHYRFVSNTTPVMLWLTDENNECVFLNQTWENVTGQSFEDGKGFGWLDHTHPDDFERVQEEFIEASKKQVPFNLDYRLRRKDGQYTWVFDSGAPLINEDGKFLGYTGSVIDINDRKIAEQKMHSLTEQLALSNKELAVANEEINAGIEELSAKNTALSAINTDMDNFIYTASHDLKAPIANIEGLVKSLERNIGPNLERQEMVDKLISMIYQSVDRFKKTIVDLTEITKIQKETPEDQAEVDLIEIIDDLKRDFHFQMEEDDVQLLVEIEDNCSTVIFARKKLKSIVYNLLSNAIKYRSPERRPIIRISFKSIPGYMLLTVKDNGLGFGEKAGSKIFSMFKRLHTHVEGSGIGLYIVKKIVDDAGGKVEVESKVNVGTTFRIFFKDKK